VGILDAGSIKCLWPNPDGVFVLNLNDVRRAAELTAGSNLKLQQRILNRRTRVIAQLPRRRPHFIWTNTRAFSRDVAVRIQSLRQSPAT
jgi:hypothetical protein